MSGRTRSSAPEADTTSTSGSTSEQQPAGFQQPAGNSALSNGIAAPVVTGPRTMFNDTSAPQNRPAIQAPWWAPPGTEQLQKGGRFASDMTSTDHYQRETDGNTSVMRMPAMNGPGEDKRRAYESMGHPMFGTFLNGNGWTPTIVPDTHKELLNTKIPAAARASLDNLGEDVHNPFDKGHGDYNLDEYSAVFDKLPEGFDTWDDFLNGFLLDPNGFANDTSMNPLEDFDTYNKFQLKKAGTQEDFDGSDGSTPGVGDHYHIDIPGDTLPEMMAERAGNDGDVMIVDTHKDETRTSATVQTMTDDGQNQLPSGTNWIPGSKLPRQLQKLAGDKGDPTIDHPVSGRRQFGIEHLPDGRTRFYTRGFDRQTNMAMDPQPSNMAQHGDWSSLMGAVSDRYGGQSERVDKNGDPVWGWAQQVTGESMAQSMERNPTNDDQTNTTGMRPATPVEDRVRPTPRAEQDQPTWGDRAQHYGTKAVVQGAIRAAPYIQKGQQTYQKGKDKAQSMLLRGAVEGATRLLPLTQRYGW